MEQYFPSLSPLQKGCLSMKIYISIIVSPFLFCLQPLLSGSDLTLLWADIMPVDGVTSWSS